MIITLPQRPADLEQQLERLAPWGHYFKFDEQTLTGFFTRIVTPEDAVRQPEKTFCTRHDAAEKIAEFNDAYREMITDSRRQFMLIEVLRRLMGETFEKATAYDFGCNDGMKTFYFKQAGVRRAVGFEYREDCIRRADYINRISGLGCEFVHYPVSAESPQYAEGLQPADIVASFGILHHLVDHETHIRRLHSVTKRVLVLHVAFSGEEEKDKVFEEQHIENSFKSVTGRRALTTKPAIVDMLYRAGFSYVLDVLDHKAIDEKGFGHFMAYLVAVV